MGVKPDDAGGTMFDKGSGKLSIIILFLIILLISCAAPRKADWEGMTVSGQVTDDRGRPVQGAHVYAYQKDRSSILGPADAMSEPTDEDGSYELILPEGSYNLVARWRLSGSVGGPMREGDLTGQLPVLYETEPGNGKGVDLQVKEFKPGAGRFRETDQATGTRVRGKVVDLGGKGVNGASVFAYIGPFRREPPDYTAPLSDREGRFEISLPGGGSYTIGARTGLGGKPEPGDMIGFWGGKADLVTVGEGSVVEDITIVLKPFGDTVNSER